ncbi:MAG: DUF5983 family protein [Sulfuricaulis sp.]
MNDTTNKVQESENLQASELYTLPVLSTAHLTRTDLNLLNDQNTRSAAPFRIMEDESGFFIHAGNADDDNELVSSRYDRLANLGFTAEFTKLIDSLRLSGFKYVLLDCDADASDNLPVFEHG